MHRRRHRLSLRILTAGLCILFGFACRSVAEPVARFERTSVEFGTVMQGKVIEQAFKVFNDGKEPLAIERLEFSASGMSARVKGKIAGGESTEIVITWDTSSARGPVEGQAILYINDPEHPRVLLRLAGTVKGAIEFDPRPAFYMSQFQGEQQSRSITIRNNQERPLRVTRLEPKGKHFLASYTVTEPGKAIDLNVVVPAATEAGRFRESVIVHTDDPKHPRLHVEVNVLVKPELFIDPDVVDFGRVSRSELEAHPDRLELLHQALVIARRHGAMTIKSVETDAEFLTIEVQPDGAAQTFKVDIGLIPSKLSSGPVDTTLQFLTDDPKNPRIVIPVKGSIVD